MNGPGFIKRHPVLTYYILTFTISWGALLVAVGVGGLPRNPEQLTKMIPVLIIAMLGGPSVASILLTGVVGGKAGYRELLSRLFKCRVEIRWYAAALLTAPLLLMAIPLALSLRFPEFTPHIFTDADKRSLLQMGFTAGLSVGIFEELGWTGFVIPRLRPHFDALQTGAIVGFLWGAWHIPVNLLSSITPSATLSISNLLGALIFSFGILPSYRVLMVWVYDHTESLLIAVLMHLSLTASNIIFGLSAAKGMTSAGFSLVLSTTLWVVIAVSVIASRRHRPVYSMQR
jgi:membrane protease YdiL (CAAX protease family)